MSTWSTPSADPLRTRAGVVTPPPSPSTVLLDALPGLAALCVLTGGLVHLDLWDDGRRDTDIAVPFLVNGIASIVIAIALVVWRHWAPALAGFGLSIGTLLAFGLSRTSIGVKGFGDYREYGWNPSPEAALTVIVEVAAAALLLAVLVRWVRVWAARTAGPPAPPPITGRDGLPRLTPPVG